MSDRDRYKARTPLSGVPITTTDTRDIRRPVPSLPGVLPQMSRIAPQPESWEGHRAVTEVSAAVGDESPLQIVVRRSGETKNNTLETLDRVDLLRRETSGQIDKLDDKFGALVEVVGVVKTEVAVTKGQNDVIITTLGKIIDQQGKAREQSGMLRLTGYTAELELNKQRALADIDQRVKWGDTLRSTVLKITAAVIAGVSAIGAAYLIGRG